MAKRYESVRHLRHTISLQIIMAERLQDAVENHITALKVFEKQMNNLINEIDGG